MYPVVTLKPGKEITVAYRHPWIFSGALKNEREEIQHGSMVWLADDAGKIIATGTYSGRSTIAVRIFEFDKTEIDGEWIRRRILRAQGIREDLGYGPGKATTGYRVLFGEADGLPGVVVDRYGSVLVMQLATAGAEAIREVIVEQLVDVFQPSGILERSELPSRREEGLADVIGVRYGTPAARNEFLEYGMRFTADVMTGQKTGFYLDQKDLRREIRWHARRRKALNLFSYTGAMAAAALAGRAVSVHNVDSSEAALAECKSLAEMNGCSSDLCTTEAADVFQWLGARNAPEYDMVILDPPALIKSQKDAEEGRKGYHFLNRAAMRLVRDGGVLVSSSCSTYFTEEEMVTTLRRGSVQVGVELDVMAMVRQSSDHPISLYFPESYYLKTFICRVRR